MARLAPLLGEAAPVSSFVGRQSEVATLKRLLMSSRIVTLAGAGGVGKTRLALQVAADVAHRFADGVYFVELASVTDPALLGAVVCSELGLHNVTSRRSVAVLAEYLAERRMLLVLDNCERLLDGCAELLEELFRSGIDLRVLLTSRQPMGMVGETVQAVAPLRVPDPGEVLPLHRLVQFDAVALFTERAAAAVPGFSLTDANGHIVTGICRRLDGLPLAIELAAIQMGSMSADQVLDRLTERHALRSWTLRGKTARQRTLWSSIDWSFQACSPAERALGWGLAVFEGWFEQDAAAGISDEPTDELPDLLAGLVAQSLLLREEVAGAEVRYRMLETIREYGLAQLRASGREAAVRRRHRQWYEQLLRSAIAEWVDRQVYWYGRLKREQSNLRAALIHWLTEPGEAPAVLQMLVALPMGYWRFLSTFDEGLLLIGRALRLVPELSSVRALALLQVGFMTTVVGDRAGGAEYLRAGRELAERTGDPSVVAFALVATGLVRACSGDSVAAIAEFERGLTHLTGPDDLAMRATVLNNAAVAAIEIRDFDRATAFHQEVLALTEGRGDRLHRSAALQAGGLAAWLSTRNAELATTLHHQCLRARQELGDLNGYWACFETLASMASAQGGHRRAVTLLGIAYRLREATGAKGLPIPHLAAEIADCERRARTVLGNKAFTAAGSEGLAMSDEEACRYALQEQAPAAMPTRQHSSAALTHREQQVADLIAQGLTNRQIAARLSIAVRTVESHVESILRKLGVGSRTQVAIARLDGGR